MTDPFRLSVAAILDHNAEYHIDQAQARHDDYLRAQKRQRVASWKTAAELVRILVAEYPDLLEGLNSPNRIRTKPEDLELP